MGLAGPGLGGFARAAGLSFEAMSASGKSEGPVPYLSGARPSKCADESRRAEQARIWAMSPRERMIEALELGEWLDELASNGDGQKKP